MANQDVVLRVASLTAQAWIGWETIQKSNLSRIGVRQEQYCSVEKIGEVLIVSCSVKQ